MGKRDIPNIDTLGEAGDIASPIGSRAWAIAVRGELAVCLNDEASNRGRIKNLTELLQETNGYRHLSDARGKSFASWRAFCETPSPWGLGYDAKLLQAMMDEHDEPIALRVMQAAGQTAEGCPKDTPRRTRADQNGISKTTQKRIDYLACNAPELHDAVKRGEMGAIGAYNQARGIKKITIAADVKGAAIDLKLKFDPDEIAELKALL